LKIIFWNIKFFGSGKLDEETNSTAVVGGLGNTYADYIVKVVAGDEVWKNATSEVPADIFVIVELKSGGDAKGSPGNGACDRVLGELVPAMNEALPMREYKAVDPLVVGWNEVVGVIYDASGLTYVSSEAMRDTAGNYLADRTPFRAEFTVKATKRKLNVVGIHGPTSQPAQREYRRAVEFTNFLGNVAAINQAGVEPKYDLCIGGDFNCCPNDFYVHSPNTRNERRVYAFDTLKDDYGYATSLFTPTKTSLKNNIVNHTYLNEPYDNIIFKMPSQVKEPPVAVIDLVGDAPTWATAEVGTFNLARRLSDHLPMCIEY
jgi:hypothetical protein